MPYNPTQTRRLSAGLCIDCGEERGADGTTVSCRRCARVKSARASSRKAAQRAQWQLDESACNSCGATLPSHVFKTCEPCRLRIRGYLATRKLSSKHRKTDQVASAKRKARKAAEGVCVRCNAASTHESRYCATHWLENSVGKYGFKRDQYAAMWAKLEAQGFQCYYTGVDLVPGVNASLDHLTPRSRGGDATDVQNCVWCDRLINAFKNDLTEAEFVERCRVVARRAGA